MAAALVLPWNYYGMQTGGLGGPSIRPYTSAAMALFSIVVHGRILHLAVSVSKKVDDPVGKAGFRLIAGSQACLIGFVVLVIADGLYYALTDLTGYTIFNYLAWLVAAVFFPLAYLGLVMPAWLRARLQGP